MMDYSQAFAHARRSVNQSDLTKYDNFRMKFDPLYKTQVGATGDAGVVINWPDVDNQFSSKERELLGGRC